MPAPPAPLRPTSSKDVTLGVGWILRRALENLDDVFAAQLHRYDGIGLRGTKIGELRMGMCRLYGFIGSEPTKVECSLVRAQNALLHQSRLDSRGRAHPDGWGIAYYTNGLPVIERRSRAAYDDLCFSTAAEQVRARVVVAHVRAASVGPSSPTNTHPFCVGRWAFAHNGTVPRLDIVGPRMERFIESTGMNRYRRGTTDSELVFLWILGRIRRLVPEGIEDNVRLETILRATRDCVLAIEGWCREADFEASLGLNFILTNGACLVAFRRGNTGYWLLRDSVGKCEVCRVCHCTVCASDPEARHETGSDYRAVVVASEPITDEPWREIPERHLLAIDGGLERVELLPL